jgi:hypothetical protein
MIGSVDGSAILTQLILSGDLFALGSVLFIYKEYKEIQKPEDE